MSEAAAAKNGLAAELREAFDRSFAQAVNTERAAVENLLAITVGADPYALKMSEVSGLFVDKKLTPMPSRVAELLGIAGFRGAILPVYDLAMLLGYPRAAAPRWLIAMSATPVALAFSSFDGYLNVPRAAIVQDARAGHARQHVREVLESHEGVRRPVLSLASLLEQIQHRARDLGKEQQG
jgi:chemotaxis signal transduction protein